MFYQYLGWFLFSCALMSFVEHQVHCRLMHRKNFLSERSDSFKKTFEEHAIGHHGYYSKIFIDEPVPPGEDKAIRLTVRKAPVKAFPIAALIALVQFEGALMFLIVVTMHHWIWNKIHLEMHKPEARGFGNWAVYKFLARYHYLHHAHPDKNFNVVFPLADFVLGTYTSGNDKDKLAMQELGLSGKSL